MAEVYDFTLYRLPRVLKSVARQAGDVVRQLDDQERHFALLAEGFRKMRDTMADFDDKLDHQRERLAQSMAQNRSCREAVASHSLTQMIAVRDRLMRKISH